MKSMFAAGLMAASASAMQLEETHQLEMPVLAAPKFAAGLIYGMVGVNSLSEIETCANDGWGEIQSAEQIDQGLGSNLHRQGSLDRHGLQESAFAQKEDQERYR